MRLAKALRAVGCGGWRIATGFPLSGTRGACGFFVQWAGFGKQMNTNPLSVAVSSVRSGLGREGRFTDFVGDL